MKCSKCGTENASGARFCASCGNPLGAAEGEDKQSPVAGGDKKASHAADDLAGAASAVVKTGSQIAGNLPNMVKNLGPKKLGIIGGAATALVLVIVVAVMLLNGGPGDQRFKDDVTAAKISWVTLIGGGPKYGEDKNYTIKSVENIQSKKSDVPEFMKQFVGSDVYEYQATVKASNGSIEAQAKVEGSYYKNGGDWLPISSPHATGDISYKAVKPVDEKKVAEDGDNILASVSGYGSNITSIYKDVTPKVSDVKLSEDGKTCTATLTYEKSAIYYDAKATVKATFNADHGIWNLTDADADENADKLSYDKLIGTWKGTFKKTSHGAFNGNKGLCYGAKDKEFTLKINSIDPDSLKVEGTYSGLVHYHDPSESDVNSSDGDTMVTDQPFTATLSERFSFGDYSGTLFDMGTDYDAPKTGDDQVSIAFGFGGMDDPNDARAMLSTDHEYTAGSFTWSISYHDIYTITKSN